MFLPTVRTQSLVLVAIMVPALAGACGSRPAGVSTPPMAAAATDLVLLHTNDNWGETRPCG